MGFFYINNDQCIDCDKCNIACSTTSIFISNGKRYIDYDKCTLCGDCLRSCRVGAISLESMNKVAETMENNSMYLERIQRLENELSTLKERLYFQNSSFTKVIQNLPLATFVVDGSNKILIANVATIDMLDLDPFRRSELADYCIGEYVDNIFPDEIISFIKLSVSENGDSSYNTTLNGKPVLLSMTTLSGDLLFGTIRDLSDHCVASQEIVKMLKETIDRKIAMVQNIGSLLGEEVSVVVNNLNEVIKIAERSNDE